ncbi:ribonuclease HIII [Chitinivibrio alkaliphilus]|uniref:Ribonuclease n=1 Tax=Chitinivibrio alkaliphilus ACht1 TaxID=1313304 RepID=U7DCR0_9BACT|nr:ribonuclease HIII [Chitinivibrio alkaliphilus]ERP39348.1 ribonuclease HIII [Chitinivibrio alkaliphilus ACht1]
MSQFSIKPEIHTAVKSREEHLLKAGIEIRTEKEIPYGTIYTVEGPRETGKITLYYSRKKGLSLVRNTKNEVAQKAEDIIFDRQPVQFHPRIGTDEAGKGDLFGPLVCCAFYIETAQMEQELRQIGIRDSKRLKDSAIHAMAHTIMTRWPDHYVLVAPRMKTYNNLYDSIGNLNKLLGWMHGRAMADLAARWNERGAPVTHAVADKFGPSQHITNSVGGLEELTIEAVTKGEEKELAIAAASIIARSSFVQALSKLQKTYDIDFPLGCANRVIPVAKKFFHIHGKERGAEVMKMHFKTVKNM